MGNGQPRYFSQQEAMSILGNDTFNTLRLQLIRICGRFIDYNSFYRILIGRFERMPTALCECLFQGFATDEYSKIDVIEFISSLAVLRSQDRSKVLRFIFRIYSADEPVTLQRIRTEKILNMAYDDTLDEFITRKQLESLFGSDPRRKQLNLKELETYEGPINLLEGWVKTVLGVFLEPLPPRLVNLERRYSLAQETERLMAQYGLSQAGCEQLKNQFFAHSLPPPSNPSSTSTPITYQTGSMALSTAASKGELSLETWLLWTRSHILPGLATAIFMSKLGLARRVWRFVDFVEFCMVFGMGPLEQRAAVLVSTFQRQGQGTGTGHSSGNGNGNDSGVNRMAMRRMITLLSRPPPPSESTRRPSGVGTSLKSSSLQLGTPISTLPMSLAGTGTGTSNDNDTTDKSVNNDMEGDVTDEELAQLPSALLKDLQAVEALYGSDPPSQAYSSLLSRHYESLPSMQELNICACCLFGVRPSSPRLEQQLVMELLVRHNAFCRLPDQPYGPPGTEWCLLPSQWWTTWQRFVGSHEKQTTTNASIVKSPSVESPTAGAVVSGQSGLVSVGVGSDMGVSDRPYSHPHPPQPPSPSASSSSMTVKVSDLLLTTCSMQQQPQGGGSVGQGQSQQSPGEPPCLDNWIILRKTDAKQLLPVVPPVVFDALVRWYGGGPRVLRQVVLLGEGGVGHTRGHGHGRVELELHPLCLRVGTCDNEGRVRGMEKEQLFSKTDTVTCVDLCQARNLDPSKARLWNCLKELWKEQYILSPELTLEQAKLRDGQLVLLEVCSPTDGSWPRSRLIASLDISQSQSAERNSSSSGHSNSNNIITSSSVSSSTVSPLSPVPTHFNQGLVGLENMGNTCYMNASLQALLHTEPLVRYFLEKRHLRDVNIQNKFGYGGRLAHAFGKLAMELIFRNEVSSLKSQFRGNEQHDAQELLAFLLDGLSEDLNLVHEKPYTEQPDSEGRPDHVLADIWWTNHFKRDRSVVQTIFSGQFKSVIFEPFNLLALPLPDDTPGSRLVYVVSRFSCTPVLVSVRVIRGSLLRDVVNELKGATTSPIGSLLVIVHTLAVVMVMVIRMDSLPDTDAVFFYESPQRRGEGGVGVITTSATMNSSKRVAVAVAHEMATHTHTSMSSVTRDGDRDGDGDGEGKGVSAYRPSSKVHVGVQIQPSPISIPIPDSRRSPRSMDRYNEISSDRDARVEAGNVNGNEGYEYTAATNTGGVAVEGPGTRTGTGAMESEDMGHASVRVVFVMRRASLDLSGRNLETFLMEPFGTPVLEVVSRNISGRQLYERAATRFSSLMKAKVSALGASASTSAVVSAIPDLSTATAASSSSSMPHHVSTQSQSHSLSCSLSVEDAVGGPVPPHGFVIRFVTQSGVGCPSCPWLSRCEGCVIIADDHIITLSDGDTLALDWHYVVYQELIDTAAAVACRKHSSVDSHVDTKSKSIPLSRCLGAMFGEDERLEGGMCPRCRYDRDIRNKLSLWRLPPVLVLQLKRFQFDRRVRRKLTNLVDFPLDGLDMWPHLAASRQVQLGEKNRDGAVYDLYAVVHHLGAMGGGHYVATVRDQEPPVPVSGGATTTSAGAGGGGAAKWRIFNDDQIGLIDTREVVGPSAYLLFYRRRTMTHTQGDDIDLDIDQTVYEQRGSGLPSSQLETTGTTTVPMQIDTTTTTSPVPVPVVPFVSSPSSSSSSPMALKTVVPERVPKRGYTEEEFDHLMSQSRPSDNSNSTANTVAASASQAIAGAAAGLGIRKEACSIS
eukprot:gene826-1606_t